MKVISINQRPTLLDLQLKLLDVIQQEPFANISIAETLGVLEMVKHELMNATEAIE
jgi:hypothetical protein